MLSDSVDAHRKALADGCDAVISIYPGMFHEFQMSMNMFPESKRAWEEVEHYIHDMYNLSQFNRSKRLIKSPSMQNAMKEKLVEIRNILEKEKEQN